MVLMVWCFYHISVNKHYYYLPIIDYLLCIIYALAIIYKCYISLRGRHCEQHSTDEESKPQEVRLPKITQLRQVSKNAWCDFKNLYWFHSVTTAFTFPLKALAQKGDQTERQEKGTSFLSGNYIRFLFFCTHSSEVFFLWLVIGFICFYFNFLWGKLRNLKTGLKTPDSNSALHLTS